MKGLRKTLRIIVACIFSLFVLVGCTDNAKDKSVTEEQTTAGEQTATKEQTAQKQSNTEDTVPVADKGSIILATTTSTQDSGLLDYILPDFKEKTGIEAKVVAVGTGKALQMGVDGEADVLLVHAKSSEEEFVANGDGVERFDVMYNDFVIVGPKDDSAKIEEQAKGDVGVAFTKLSEGQYKFISRGDDSGTDKKEKGIWKEIGIEPQGDWYVSTGKGMGEVLQMTNELLGYTLSDRATFLSMKDSLDLRIVVESDTMLLNQYGVIAVNPEKNKNINAEGAQAFIEWILSDETQKLIGKYGVEEYGETLFTPNAKK